MLEWARAAGHRKGDNPVEGEAGRAGVIPVLADGHLGCGMMKQFWQMTAAMLTLHRYWATRSGSGKAGMKKRGAEEESALLEAAAKAATSGKLIVTFCNSNYSRLLDNWLIAIERIGPLPILVCALDKPLELKLREEGVPVTHIPCEGVLSNIWSARISAIQTLVTAGYAVTQSDVDAVWLKNPMPVLECLDADIISSQGTIYPISALREWGHVLCCGFMQFRPTEYAKDLLKDLVFGGVQEEGFDDQKSLNELLLKRGLVWSQSEFLRTALQQRTLSMQPGRHVRGSSGR